MFGVTLPTTARVLLIVDVLSVIKKEIFKENKMNPKVFTNIYDYYDLPEEERFNLLETYCVKDNYIYFPIWLSEAGACQNYNEAFALLGLLEPYTIGYGKQKGQIWFKVYAFSPDDLDLDLEFYNEVDKYELIFEYLKNEMPRIGGTYKDFLLELQKKFGGELC